MCFAITSPSVLFHPLSLFHLKAMMDDVTVTTFVVTVDVEKNNSSQSIPPLSVKTLQPKTHAFCDITSVPYKIRMVLYATELWNGMLLKCVDPFSGNVPLTGCPRFPALRLTWASHRFAYKRQLPSGRPSPLNERAGRSLLFCFQETGTGWFWSRRLDYDYP
ncbi:hypothetical protein CEXT_741381 [Caerostris extrusa]|uniref:Uncharacterized protein n=1 Tax=Caerostris extrusa TaxID=172846 RepID=A0AAV4M6X7_CAEEX|nr:hypothetical protein CEXT_741381 [Caerostris extrusa]